MNGRPDQEKPVEGMAELVAAMAIAAEKGNHEAVKRLAAIGQNSESLQEITSKKTHEIPVRAKVVANSPSNNHGGQEDDEPELMRRSRERRVGKSSGRKSDLPSLIIFAFIGGMIALTAVFIYAFASNAPSFGQTSLGLRNEIGATLIGSICWGIPAFAFGGCCGAFLWAVIRQIKKT